MLVRTVVQHPYCMRCCRLHRHLTTSNKLQYPPPTTHPLAWLQHELPTKFQKIHYVTEQSAISGFIVGVQFV